MATVLLAVQNKTFPKYLYLPEDDILEIYSAILSEIFKADFKEVFDEKVIDFLNEVGKDAID